MEVDVLKAWLAEGLTLEAMGERAGKHPTTVGYWLKKHGLVAANHEKFAPRGGLEESVLRALVEEGLTVPQIATRLDRGHSTVRYWLKRYGLETPRQRFARERLSGELPRELARECVKHGPMLFRLDAADRYRCPRCLSEAVTERRRRVKQILVEEAGGCCRLCGYDAYVGALQFHHLDPKEKSFGLSLRGVARSLERARAEARKCVLLCSNCHSEVEAGYTALRIGKASVLPHSGGPG